MGKYSSMQNRNETKKQPEGLPPIWRGIGFGMMILIPGMAYVGMLVLMQYNQDHNLFPIPMDMINKTAGDPLLFIKISVVLVLMLVLYAILMMVTFLLNKIFTPSQLGPFDVPREAYRRRRRP
jgi:energy-converting hydrogenase Eha subunit F